MESAPLIGERGKAKVKELDERKRDY